MPSPLTAPRRIHLDFHTPELDFAIAREFDAETFARTVAEASVDEITVFAKCAYGYAYYDTERGQRHPNLARDLMGEQIAALQARGVQVMVHYSVGLDELAWVAHPDWRQLRAGGEAYKLRPDYWGYLCPSSPYPARKCIPELDEIARHYPIDGVFLDVIAFDEGTCYCDFCKRAFRETFGVELTPAATAADPQRLRDWQVRILREMLASFSATIKAHRPEALVDANSQVGWVGEDRRLLEPVDYSIIEASPSREFGYGELSMHLRYARTLGKPAEVMTRRFLHIWGDFMLKPTAQLKFEAATIFANGGAICIGDHLYPQGALEPPVYDAIGEVYEWIGERLAFGPQAEAVTDIALLAPVLEPATRGADRLLVGAHAAFNTIDRQSLSELNRYRALVVPEGVDLSAAEARLIRQFVDDGGGLLVAGAAWPVELAAVLGVTPGVPARFSAFYLYPDAVQSDLPDLPLLIAAPSASLRLDGAEPLARVAYPLFERSAERFFSHSYAPPAPTIDGPVLTMNRAGEGRAVLAAFDLFRSYWERDQWFLRRLFIGLLRALVDRPAMRIQAPPSVEATLMRRDQELLLHLLHFHGERPTGGSYAPIESVPLLHDLPVAVRSDGVRRVILEPGGRELPFSVADGYVRTTVPEIDIHAIVRLR